jgi:hypothetical protein
VMQARRLSVCSLSGEPDFRDGFRNWIKNQVPRVCVYLGIIMATIGRHGEQERECVEQGWWCGQRDRWTSCIQR